MSHDDNPNSFGFAVLVFIDDIQPLDPGHGTNLQLLFSMGNLSNDWLPWAWPRATFGLAIVRISVLSHTSCDMIRGNLELVPSVIFI